MFLPFCCLALVLHDNKVATTEQSREGVIYTLQSRLTLPQDLFRRTSLQKQRPQWLFSQATTVLQPKYDYLKCAKSGQKRVVKEMITGSLSFPFSFFPPRQHFHMPFTFTSFPLSASLEQARQERVWPPAPCEAKTTKESIKRKTEKGKIFCIRVV